MLQSASSTRKMDQRCPQGNRPAYTTMAKLHSSTRDLQDKFSISSAWHPQDKFPHSSWSMSGETSKKRFWKEKKKQHCLDHEQARKNFTPDIGVHALNVANTTCKDLNHITCFNYNKKGHYVTKCLGARKDSDVKD